MTSSSHFAIVTRDEIWSLDRHACLESRLIHGIADRSGDTIDARDDGDDELRARCDEERERVRGALEPLREGRARTVLSARRENDRVDVSAIVSISILDLSVATTLPHVAADFEMLRELASVPPDAVAAYRQLPVVWRNGSGAVLLHEAAGHAAEHGHAPAKWPAWLTAVDESDAGTADLLAGEMPRAIRRESFTDVPAQRMTNVVAGNRGAEMDLPLPRIEILLVAGGRYEPLTEMVRLSIAAADLVGSRRAQRLRPFAIIESRATIANALRGASGPLRRYPGVICSREGQDLFVGSFAPDLVTEF